MQDVKALLKSYIQLVRYCEKCFREVDHAMGSQLRSPKMDGMPRTGSIHGLDDQIARIDEIKRRAEKEREKLLRVREEIDMMIDSLEDYEQRFVIKQRYVYGESWDAIAKEGHISRRTAIYIHGRALTNLRRNYEN